jgi:hypothetical protein
MSEKNQNNRRKFLKNIGTVVAGTTVAATAGIASASSMSTTNVVPTFEDCYQKVLRKEILTSLEVVIYSGEMNRLAWESDVPAINKLRETCSSETEFQEQKELHCRSRNSIMFYWAALPWNASDPSVRNLIQVHKYVVNSILNIVNKYWTLRDPDNMYYK